MNERKIIQSGEWLNDRHTTAAQTLIQQDHPHIDGLQCPLLGTKLQFQVQKSGSMQILNYRGHWGCITTLGCIPGHVKVFDSMYTSPAPALVIQICVLLRTKESKLSIEMMNIQKQPNGSDCGWYVIANALTVCLGKNPCKIKWTNSLMRSHFRGC